MIVTLTANPSLDLLFSASRLVWDDANRIPGPRRRPGGQGINVVRAARAMDPDAPVMAVAPLGGPTGREMRHLMAGERTPLHIVEIADETRTFVGVRERETGRSLLLNPGGPVLTVAEGDALLRAVGAALERTTRGWLACCGSVPPGLDPDLYARAGSAAREHGHRFVADCDGQPLAAAAPHCDLLVPNAHEAGRLAGMEVRDRDDALTAARALQGAGVPMVAVTLGSLGAVMVAGEEAWWARPRVPAPLDARLAEGTAVGAGDAFLAGLLLALGRGSGPEAALLMAVAAGTASLLSRGRDVVRWEDVLAIRPHVVTGMPG
jgi:1-phosphofructokinase family hexose kinase